MPALPREVDVPCPLVDVLPQYAHTIFSPAERRSNARSTDVQPTNNHKPITNNQETKNTATSIATPDGVSPEVWDQFVKQRKVKKAQITDLVMVGIQREADKAGYTLERALTEVVVRNWTSFKADWVLENQTATQKAQANMALLTRGMTSPKPANFWDKTTTLEMIHDEPKRIL